MRNPLIGTSEKIYAWIVSWYPSRFQKEFGSEMKDVFAQSVQETYATEGSLGVSRLWARVVIDFLHSVSIAYMDEQKGKQPMATSTPKAKTPAQAITQIALFTGALLLIPLIGMQSSSEMNWDLFDFAFAGAMIFTLGMIYHFIVLKFTSLTTRLIVGGIAVFLFLLIWAELAVGIIGD